MHYNHTKTKLVFATLLLNISAPKCHMQIKDIKLIDRKTDLKEYKKWVKHLNYGQ